MKKVFSKNSLGSDKAAIIFLIIIAIVATTPIFQTGKSIGGSDWDTHLTYNLVPLKTIIEYEQFPLWNPYECGGTALLAHPESLFATPFFLLIILFGVSIGVKLQILAHLAIGMAGMYLLARNLKMSRAGSFAAAAVFMMSSIYPLHVTLGHTLWFAAAFIPWAYLFYLKSMDDYRYAFISAAFLALMLLSGSTYLFAFSGLFFAIDFIVRLVLGEKKHVKAAAIILLTTLLLVSIKLLPMLEFIPKTQGSNHGLEDDTGFGYDYKSLIYSLITNPEEHRYQQVLEGDKYYWFEYSQYIGLLGLLVALAGLILSFKRRKELVITLIIIITFSLGHNFIINLWGLLHSLPLYSSLKAPSRLNIFIVFILAIFIGEAITRIREHKFQYVSKVEWILALYLGVSLLLVNLSIYSGQFIMDHPEEKAGTFYQSINKDNKTTHQVTGWSYSMYDFALQNKGTVNCYEKVHLPIKATPFEDDDYLGESYDSASKENIAIEYWSPNRIELSRPGVINLNYDDNWAYSKDSNGVLSINNDKTYYLPKTFIVGSIISMMTVLLIILNTRRRWKQNHSRR